MLFHMNILRGDLAQLIPELKQNIQKAIYLDCDIVVTGDMNGDGKLNVFDLILLKRKIQNM